MCLCAALRFRGGRGVVGFWRRRDEMADGDTDTKAAITGTLAEAFYEVPMEFIEKALSYLPSDMLDIVNQYYDRLEAKLE
jgi:hypothetical protein